MRKYGERITRRTLLKIAGASATTAAMLPWLEAFGEPARGVKRLVVLWQPNGNVPEHWSEPATGAMDAGRFNTILSGFDSAPYRELMSVLWGVRNNHNGVGNHEARAVAALTATPRQPNRDVWANTGVSIDQWAARHLYAEPPLRRSLHYARPLGGGASSFVLSFRGPGQAVTPSVDARRFLAQFNGIVDPSPVQLEERAFRRKLLDVKRGELREIARRLGSQDRERLQAHLQQLDELSLSLEANSPLTMTQGGSCGGAEYNAVEPQAPFLTGHVDLALEQQNALNALALALCCDVTRVGVHAMGQVGNPLGLHNWPEAGEATRNQAHEQAHVAEAPGKERHDPALREVSANVCVWYANLVRYFIDRLLTLQSSDGVPLMDDTLVVWSNELGDHSTHDSRHTPFVFFAGKNITMGSRGRVVDVSLGEQLRDQGDIWTTAASLLGLGDRLDRHPNDPTRPCFGWEKFNRGVIPELFS